ncbi:MAG: EAL domain-containing protein [Clostridiales bacterium]|nr:EAL domain-containing protein [Clostridiales bacterium]
MHKQILVVEDNELNRAILCEILSGEYQVLEAENGREALNILEQHKDNISLILLDVMMPVMDGYTFLDRVKENDELSQIPVIVMTQSDNEEDEVSALSHGATDFVPKPYRPQVILHRVASIIKLRETAAMVNQFQYDRLTGLYNKEFFYRKARERMDENPEREYTIVCSNIENFKLYNDTFGREAGDQLLRDMAAGLKVMVGATGVSGRYGADRFLCIVERKREREDRERFFGETYFNRPETMQKISVKWGIYEATDRSLTVEQMCDRALLAADSIKGQYNIPFAIYDDALRGKLLREQAITDSMETALTERQFTIYYQPKYSLKEGCMVGAEALVRWIHPEWGFMSPGEFIPLFENNGFISRLDQYVWEQVCAQLRDWMDKGYPILPVSVNVSRRDVYQLNLEDTIKKLTQKYGIDPVYLHLEITESAYSENPSQIIKTVDQLRKLGFTIEMDDFGSGYSSLSIFGQMKLDILKLDMQFIQNETAKPVNQSILNDIINMAHRMYLSVVAEGVDTREQARRLQEVGCDYVQGYLFNKPMPAAEFEELLKECGTRSVCSLPDKKQVKDDMRGLLVVDEDAEYREKVRQTFERRYRVMEASDAHSALEAIRSCGTVSTVILSVTLPEEGAAAVMKAMQRDPALWEIPVLATAPNGQVIEKAPLVLEADDFLCKCHPFFDLERRVVRLLDLAEHHERESILHDEANRDYLTGLLNRRGFQEAMASLRKEELPLAVCLFDLDDLKRANDTCGHEMGDRMIRAFAELLNSQTRTGDVKCRYGGDEFVVVMKRLKDETTAINKAEDICRQFSEQFAQEHFPAACSGGIALCGVDDIPSDELIERADQALYRAKREKKGCCCMWSNDVI